jgi:hypothetical protein
MIKEALAAIRHAARTLVNRRDALALILATALALLFACYLFVTTREATTMQLLITLLAAVAAPVLFLFVQAASVNYTRDVAGNMVALLGRAARDLPKLILASLPLILLGVALIYGMNKLQTKYFSDTAREARLAEQSAQDETMYTRGEDSYPPRATPPPPLDWWGALFNAAWLLTLGILLPLIAIHIWLAVVRRGLFATLKGLFGVLRSALAPRSVTIYTLGLLAFGLLPYFLIFTRTSVGTAWLELTIFGLRLAIVFTLAVIGWVVTVGALAVADRDALPSPAANSIAPPSPSPQIETAHATV